MSDKCDGAYKELKACSCHYDLSRVKEALFAAQKTMINIGAERDALRVSCDELVKALESIEIYQSDTLSGRIDGLEDRNWFRDGIEEILKRAQEALAKHRERVEGK